MPGPYVTQADFDGNGHADEAWSLLRKRGGFRLFVFMTLPGRSPRVLWLAGARSGAAQGHVVAANASVWGHR